MALKVSPLAPATFPALAEVPGVSLAATFCGLKKNRAPDLLLISLPEGTPVAGVLTRSLCPSAPVDWCRRVLPAGRARAIVVNAGNANAFTGAAGAAAVDDTVRATAKALECPVDQVLVASTGVIGVPLPADRVVGALPGLAASLDAGAWHAAAVAIGTTDTFPKGATRTARIDGVPVTITGIAKGSGMIAPDLATMLGFVVTDALLPASVLRPLVATAADRSFNSITVDGDTSTSDTVLVAATGLAGNRAVEDPRDRRLADFRRALEEVMTDLAHQIVRDGEGAEKFVTISVTGAASSRAARRVGLAIANSPLVKTAIAGEDANWGRIVMAVGKAGEKADRDRLAIAIGGVQITRNGQVVPGYDETPVASHIRGQEIAIAVDLGVGWGKATVWTCDLTHGYITINADYRS